MTRCGRSVAVKIAFASRHVFRLVVDGKNFCEVTQLVLARASLGKESSAHTKAAPSSKPDIQVASKEQESTLEEFTPPKFAWSIGNIAMSAPSGIDPPSENNARRSPSTRVSALPWPVQAKLEVGAVDDPLEHEADRVAEQVMRMPEPAASAVALMRHGSSDGASGVSPQSDSHSSLRRKCSCGGSCDKCKAQQADDEHGKVQRKPAVPDISNLGGPPVSSGMAAPPIVHEVLGSPGQPLDTATRAFFEPRFGREFSQVRVHVDQKAAESAIAVNARAYTVGASIVFGPGQFAPASKAGRGLLGHELSHVVQQTRVEPNLSGASNLRNYLMRAPDAKAWAGESSPVRPMSRDDARAALAHYTIAQPGLDDSGAAIVAFADTLALPFTLENAAQRLRMLTAACSLLDGKDAGLVLTSITAPANAAQKALKERFGRLDRRFRAGLIALLKGQASSKPDNPPQHDETKWVENADGTFSYAPSRPTTLEKIAAYITGYPDFLPVLADKNQLSPDAAIQAGQMIVVPADFIDSSSRAFREMSVEMRKRVATVQQVMSQNKALEQSIKVRPGPGVGLIPVTGAAAEAAAQVVLRPFEAIAALIECLVKHLDGDAAQALKNRAGVKLAVAMEASFGPGAIWGATKEIGRIAEQVAHIVAHPLEFVKQLWEFFKLMFSAHAVKLGCAMGEDLAEEIGKEIGSLVKNDSDFELAFGLGELAGPLLLNTLLSLLAPEIVAGLRGTRVCQRLLHLLKDLKGELKFLDKWRKRGEHEVGLGKEAAKIERAEQAIVDAEKYLKDHPPGPVEGKVPGERHAPAGEHDVKEVKEDGHIHCELWSDPPHRRLRNCPPGFGDLDIGEREGPRGEAKARQRGKEILEIFKEQQEKGRTTSEIEADLRELLSEKRTLGREPRGRQRRTQQARERGVFSHDFYEQLEEILKPEAEGLVSEKLAKGLEKEYQIPNTKLPRTQWQRIDRLDRTNGVVIEIKPEGLAGEGLAEAKGYALEMDKYERLPPGPDGKPRKWQAKVVTYDGRKVTAFLKAKGYF